ncbi:hypothetical protein D1007_06784 [Hordeum vulgare]|nr:hypothetical protein D1007_06784 [Hordeum vulgare]
MTTTRGTWDGSDIDEEYIECLRRHHKLSLAQHLVAHITVRKYTPAPEHGEVVVFAELFARGLGLPASTFFFRFLTHFGQQPHHLSTNTVLQLAAFVTLCEGFLGSEPRVDL